ncbi:hypothetical protein ABLT50_12195 [Acinetobacter calcoaceticus]|uniref:hypothetical protein n=1 Tax=Acinetobacter calcoaceticus TaxID=471 RepID=UPI00321AA2E1
MNEKNNNDKKSSRELFLFTAEGRKAVMEYMRNLTPQVLVGSAWVVFAVRSMQLSFSWQTLVFWCVTCAMVLLFFYIVTSNMVMFINESSHHMDNRIKGIEGYTACENPYGFKVWIRHLRKTLKLVYKNEKILFVEFILTIFFLITPTIIVFLIAAKQADDLYRSLIGG